MKRFLIRVSALLLAFMILCPLDPAAAEPYIVIDGISLVRYLTDFYSLPEDTILLANDILLQERELNVRVTSVTIDGQGHAIRTMPDNQIIPSGNKYLKLQNMSGLGPLSIVSSRSKVDLENVVLTGDYYGFTDLQATLSSVRTDRIITKDSKKTAVISIHSASRNEKVSLYLDENCVLEKDWLLRASNADLVADCDYYDAEVSTGSNKTVSFSGKGYGRGTMNVFVREQGKINVDAQVEKLRVSFTEPGSKKNQAITVKGSARSVEIQTYGAFQKSQKLNLQLSGVGKVRFVIWLYGEKRAKPTGEEEEKLRKTMLKSAANVSLKKVTDSDGNPIQEVTYEIVGWDAQDSPWTIEWTEAWSGK